MTVFKDRHIFYNEHISKVNERIELLEEFEYLSNQLKEYINELGKNFFESREKIAKNHKQTISPLFGNYIEEGECDIYYVE